MTTDETAHIVHATYRVRPDAEPAFAELLRRHHPTLTELGLVEEGCTIYRREADGVVTFVEIFTWRPGAVDKAHTHPEVAAIWEPMGKLMQEVDGEPQWSFHHYERWS